MQDAETPSLDEIFSFLEKRRGMLDAVCITGGEPTMHKNLEYIIHSIKNMGYKVKLDTNGTNPEVIQELIHKNLLDYIAMDVKAPIGKYHEITNCDVNTEDIQKTIHIVMNSGVDYEFRTTFMPDLNHEDIHTIAQSVAGSKRYVLQQFRNQVTLDEAYLTVQPHKAEYVAETAENIKDLFKKCEVRGI
jgi:pyruvate formate lyase activating enzyme